MSFRTLTAAGAVWLTLAQAQTAPPPPPPSPSPLAAAAAAAAAARGDTKEAGLGKPIAITFNWPAGMTAIVEAERTRTRVTPAGPQTTGSGIKYRVRANAHPQGRLITFDDVAPLRTLHTAGESSEFEQVLAGMLPSLIVSKNGDFVRVTDLSKIQAFLRQTIGEFKDAPPDAKEIIDNLSSEQVLTNLASQDWEMFAGVWAGYKGKIGELTEVESEEESPVVPGLKIPMRTSFGAVRQTPCMPGAAPDSCVLMQLRSTVAPGAMGDVVKKVMGSAPGLQGVAFDRFDVLTEITAIVEPATAKPHKITHARRTDMTMRQGAQSASVSQAEQRVYRITYQ